MNNLRILRRIAPVAAFAAMLFSGMFFSGCTGDEPDMPDKPEVCPPDSITPTDSITPPDTVPADTFPTPPQAPSPVNAEPYELTLSFVDSEGRDLLAPSHPSNMVGSIIMYDWDGMGLRLVTPADDAEPHPSSGLRTVTIASPHPIAYNDYGRKSTIYWAEGSHSDIITVTDADSLGQRFFSVNNSEPKPLDGTPIILRSDDAGFYYYPNQIPFVFHDVKGREIVKPVVTAIIDGEEYPCDPDPRGELRIFNNMGISWPFPNTYSLTDTEREVTFSGLRFPARTLLCSGNQTLKGYDNVVVLGDLPRDRQFDLKLTLRVSGPSGEEPQLFEVEITNDVRPIADYIRNRLKIVVDSIDRSSEYYFWGATIPILLK